jgi:ATP-binding cassette subfamily C protein
MINRNLKILFEFKDRIKLLIMFIANIFSAIFELIGIGSIPIFAMIIVDVDTFMLKISKYVSTDIFEGMSNQTITIYAGSIMILIFILKNVLLFFINLIQARLLKNLRSITSNKLFEYYITLPYLEIMNKNPATLIRTMETDIAFTYMCVQSYIVLFKEFLVLLLIFILLFLVDPIISGFSFLLVGIPVLLFYAYYRSSLKTKGVFLQQSMDQKMKTINQSFGLIKETKIMSREGFFLKYFFKINQKVEELGLFSHMISVSPRLFLEVMALISVASVSIILIYLGRSPETILPIISLLSVSVIRFIPSFTAISTSLTNLRFRTPSLNLITNELKKYEVYKSSFIKNLKENKNFEAKKAELRKNILLKDVSFNYESRDKIAVNNVNIDIKKGSIVGIIGRSGSGKSTLVDIILGLLDPAKGNIYVDDKNLNDFKKSWQKQIGYIPQDIYLLDDTIRNNIVFGIDERNIDENLINEVIKLAQLEKLVNSLPNKLETVVGNRGIKLSGGERQRIAIARAIYNKPLILILDEATSALDIDNENKILDEIYENKKDKTILIISHRNNTVKNCDMIYVMENGRIVDNGKFNDVMKRNSFLKETN